MCEVYNRIETLCSKEGINITQMCKNAKVSRSSLSDFYKGRTKKLSTATVEKIAEYFNVSFDYILYGITKDPTAEVVEPLDAEFLEIFNKLTDSEKKLVRAQILGILNNR